MQKRNSSVQLLRSKPNLRKRALAKLAPGAAETLEWAWTAWARPSQLPPGGDWLVWLVLAGRGWGKTRTGAEWVRAQAESNTARRIALVAPTAADARDVMVEGHSGILSVGHPDERPAYEPSKRRLTWPNGVVATTFSADEPDRLRGPQFHAAWCDELAAWRYPEAWDMLQFGLRMGHPPRTVVTTTPRPVRLIREMLASPSTEVTRGATYENRANLSEAFLQRIASRYEGTRLGRQEVHAELLDDVEGALWQRKVFQSITDAPDLLRVVVAIDPAVSYNDGADETGIVVAGRGVDGNWYVLADRSCRLSPDGWARRVVRAHREFAADRIIGESQQRRRARGVRPPNRRRFHSLQGRPRQPRQARPGRAHRRPLRAGQGLPRRPRPRRPRGPALHLDPRKRRQPRPPRRPRLGPHGAQPADRNRRLGMTEEPRACRLPKRGAGAAPPPGPALSLPLYSGEG